MNDNHDNTAQATAMSDQAGAFLNDTMRQLVEAGDDIDAITAALSRTASLDRAQLDCVVSHAFGQLAQFADALDHAHGHYLRIAAAIKLVYPDDLTPAGKRVLELALASTTPTEKESE